ncbi:methionine ABC transporter ATP-binding protein [Paenibacillus sp. 32O-W]|uniref:Methionine import ATP-binding protein MetN 2 n=1 Tax=Paenibacillus cisolokensis TaxID=1658519 RepID=A0ABQ4N5S5_9BACL|nr:MULTISPECIES: methionine ABC transporter ATP-binding protein [Paenibacillus]ALS28474.1 methionine ABC transporter ATP-binding protein [Paenibacillus sp. 32O-W]GIQ63520.1 methionine import ATP-binding protein MetN 2 [Paenibacillus cisolokensis]
MTEALTDIELTVEKGDIFGVIGHSGAGKSTLLRCVNLLERPTSGKVVVNGKEMTALREKELQQERRRIGMIFQHFNLLSTATVTDNIAFPLKLAKWRAPQIKERVDELLELVGLRDHAAKYPSQLSGGQKQRVGIARALATNPDVLLCDEATSALDPQTTQSILQLLQDINEKLGITILLITHEMHVIRSICNRVAVMDGGRIVERGDVLDVFLKPQHPVTREFVGQVSERPDGGFASARHDGTVLRIQFVGESTYEPVLYEVVRETDATFAILQGTVSRMKNTPYGQLLVELRGTSGDTDRIVRRLRERGVDVEVMS